MFNKQIKAYFLLKAIGACDASIHVLADDWQPHVMRYIDALGFLMTEGRQLQLLGVRVAVRVARHEQHDYHSEMPDPFTKAIIEDALYEVIEDQFWAEATETDRRKFTQLDVSLGFDDPLIETPHFWQDEIPF